MAKLNPKGLRKGDTVYVHEPSEARSGQTGTVIEVGKYGYSAWVRFPGSKYSELIKTWNLRKEG